MQNPFSPCANQDCNKHYKVEKKTTEESLEMTRNMIV